MQLIPAIDLLDGCVTRLFQGDFAQSTRYAERATDIATRWRARGANVLHVVDLNAARGDANDNRERVHELAGVDDLVVQCGGGVRSRDDVMRLLGSGAARVVIGSLAVRQPPDVQEWMRALGAERVVIALDVKTHAGRDPEVLTQGWLDASGKSLWPVLDDYAEAGMQHLLCTDVSRDGTLSGSNVALYSEILRRYPELGLQASGGIGCIDDIRALRDAGVPAAILGRALLDGRLSLDDAFGAAA